MTRHEQILRAAAAGSPAALEAMDEVPFHVLGRGARVAQVELHHLIVAELGLHRHRAAVGAARCDRPALESIQKRSRP